MCLRVAYVGITFNEKHNEMTYDFLFERMKTAMAEVGHPRYDATYAEAIGCKADDPNGGKKKAKAKPKAKTTPEAKGSKAKGKAKAKKPSKKKAGAAADDEGDESGSMVTSDDDDDDSGDDDDVWDPLAAA